MRGTSNEDEIHFNDPINHVVKFKDLKTSISRLDEGGWKKNDFCSKKKYFRKEDYYGPKFDLVGR